MILSLIWNDGKERKLIDNPLLDGWRLNNQHCLVLHVFIIFLQTGACLLQHLHRESSRSLLFHHLLIAGSQSCSTGTIRSHVSKLHSFKMFLGNLLKLSEQR